MGGQTKNLKTGECWVKGVGALEIMTPYKLCKDMLLRRVLRSLSNIYDGAFCKKYLKKVILSVTKCTYFQYKYVIQLTKLKHL